MDFLKTLMLYMTITFAATVQGAPTPDITAAPTPAPTAIVTPAPVTDVPDAEITPAPTRAPAMPTPQEAAITPNPKYRNLARGSRGANVKELQSRLIELGYLSGTADGAYGGKTEKAVRTFQYYNGLQQDGIAGKMTQTVLFESEFVVANPDVTPAPTDTPEPTPTAEPEVTGEPAADTTAEPDAEPTAEPAETPTETPQITEAPAETEAPQEIPAPTDEAVFPTDATIFRLEGAQCVLNESGRPMVCLRTVNGEPVEDAPRIYLVEEQAYVNLQDLAVAEPEWGFAAMANGWQFTAAGCEVLITRGDEGWQVQVNDEPVAVDETALLYQDEQLLAGEDFFAAVLNADAVWDAGEKTLLLHVEDASEADAQE